MHHILHNNAKKVTPFDRFVKNKQITYDFHYNTNDDKRTHRKRLGKVDFTRTCPTLELRIAGLALPIREIRPTGRW